MKRITLTLISIISVLWIFPICSKAYSPEVQYVLDWLDYTGSAYNDSWVSSLESTWKDDRQLLIYAYGVPNNREAFISYDGSPFTVSGSNVTMYQRYAAYNNNGFNSVLTNTRTLTDGGDNGLIKYFGSREDVQENLIDFETVYYDPTVPTPNFNVYMTRPDTWQNISEETNFFNISWSEYSNYYIQIGYKYSVPNSMKVGVTDGNKVYTPLSYFDSQYLEIYSLEDMHSAIGLNASVNSTDFVWQSYSIDDPESWQATVPPWVHNYNNSAYVSARNNWNNKLALCMPLYGNRLEIFARLFYVENGGVYVGAWRHWNNSYPTEYGEELPQNYQVDNAIPGYQNTSNNTEYQDETNTITSIGDQTGVNTNPTVIVNNLTPNYPDYPTVATYNHDNILLQFFTTAKQLPSSFSGFTSFLSASLTWIPSYIWDIIALGLLASITVMVIKIL